MLPLYVGVPIYMIWITLFASSGAAHQNDRQERLHYTGAEVKSCASVEAVAENFNPSTIPFDHNLRHLARAR